MTNHNEYAKDRTYINSSNDLISPADRVKLKNFRDMRINHPILRQSFDELWEAVNNYNDGSLILLFGSSGVGKTTVLELLEKKFRQELKAELKNDREIIPLVRMEIMGASNRKFDWKDFYREILEKLSEFSIDNRVDHTKWEKTHQPWLPFDTAGLEYKNVANDTRSTESRLRKAVEKALLHRRPKVILLDEAQHLTALSTGRSLLDQQNVIKSLANRTGTTHALFGTYELMAFRDLNGQLARRTVNVHFRRYVNTSKNDFRDFEEVIWNFQQQLPVDEPADLLPLTKYLYEGCFGCIGILKNWLYQALCRSFSGTERTLTKTHLEQTRVEDVKLLKIAQECVDGERGLRSEKTEAKAKLHDLLGYKQIVNGNNAGKTKTKGTRLPGVRNPCRDAVGMKMSA